MMEEYVIGIDIGGTLARAVVLTIDTISAAVRRRIIKGSDNTDEDSRTLEAITDLTGIRS